MLCAADFLNGKVDVFDGSFRKVAAPGQFVDPSLPAGSAPFGIRALVLDGQTAVVVTCARQDPERARRGAATRERVRHETACCSGASCPRARRSTPPSAAVVAPATFGSLANMLLIGNFGDGVINAFDPATGAFVDTPKDAAGLPLSIDGLWGRMFGNDTNGQSATSLCFAAGNGEEAAGVYGRIDVSR